MIKSRLVKNGKKLLTIPLIVILVLQAGDLTNISPFLTAAFWIVLAGAVSVFVVFIFNLVNDFQLMDSVTKTSRGTESERQLVVTLMKNGFQADSIFHDLYIKKRTGYFSQIDLVAVTNVGIIVFEVKDFSGWIYGNGKNENWTKVLAYGKEKYRFYNPILQNKKHIDDLKKHLGELWEIPFFSVIVFYGDCELKEISFVPKGTFLVKSQRVMEAVKQILKENPNVEYTYRNQLVDILKDAVKNGSDSKNRIKHTQDIEDMLGKSRIFG